MFSEDMLGSVFVSPKGVIKLSVGQVFPTETIQEDAFEPITTFSLKGSAFSGEGTLGWQFELKEEDVVYGLGESLRGMNKRGYVYEAFCTDDPVHTPDKTALYGAHNFFLVQGEETFGVYVESPGYVKFDVGFEEKNRLKIHFESPNFDLYFFEGSFKDIVKTFRKMIGLSYVPPKWALGYQQSRWSYENHEVVKHIAEKIRHHQIPCDAIYLDIDYMVDFKDFTVDDTRFPSFESFVSEMASKGFRLVPIIDAGVKIESGYDVYEEGINQALFMTDQKGEPFVAAVWPGKVHFPDFLNPETRAWFGQKYHGLISQGIEGFWNDMNEPAIFYSEKKLNEAFAFVKEQEDKNLDIYSFFKLKDQFLNLSGSVDDYKAMYHTTPSGRINHYDVHNLYGYYMTRSADEGFKAFDANRRMLLLTRASHIGMAKHSGIWTGDNHSWWEHLKLNVQMMPALNMAGFLYSGADTGGFGGNTSAELLTRWVQFSVFTPLLRNHSAMGTRNQEPWAFDEKTLGLIRNALRFRYALIPYLYSEFMKANLNHDLLFAPLSYQYTGRGVEDQLLFGDGLMLTPIYEQNARGRYVHLPERMAYVPITTYENLLNSESKVYEAGDYFVNVPMDTIPLWIRKNKLITLTKPEDRVEALDESKLVVVGFVDDFARYTLYNDDGISKAYEQGTSKKTIFEVKRMASGYHVMVDTNEIGRAHV